MYVEFSLPQGAGGQAAAYTHFILSKELDKWSKHHNIPYHKKIIKYQVKVTFTDPEHYTLFALTWEPTPDKPIAVLKNFRLIEPMK